MPNRNALRVSFFVAAVAAFVSTTSLADPLVTSNKLTFQQTVALPGVTLPAGTYVFERDSNSSNHIVRVLTTNYQRMVYVGFTTPVTRPTGLRSAVVFGEARAGEPLRIAAWYPIGSNQGHQFLYR
jgi:hypothetical protein